MRRKPYHRTCLEIARIDGLGLLICMAAQHPFRSVAQHGREGLGAGRKLGGGRHCQVGGEIPVMISHIRFGTAGVVAHQFVLRGVLLRRRSARPRPVAGLQRPA